MRSIASKWLVAGYLALLGTACGSSGAGPEPEYREGLALHADATSITGTFGQDGRLVRFAGSSNLVGEARLHLELEALELDLEMNLGAQTYTEDAHGSTFELRDRAILLALRDAVMAKHPDVIEMLHGRLLVRAVDRFAEAPVGPPLVRREVDVAKSRQALAVTGGCGGDGVTCLPGTSGSSIAIFFASGICDARTTPYGDSVCRGRCGMGCNWFDNDYTWDCLDHDVCLDYSNDCNDEFTEAADDWAATMAPLCWSGTTRSMPPAACTNECAANAAKCDGNTVVKCGQFDSDSCLEWGGTTACAATQTCTNGACVELCVDSQCATPPAATCVSETTLRTFSAGACAEGACQYPSVDTPCAHGCADAHCVEPPPPPPPPVVWINELHYDNDGVDAGEGVEVAGTAGADLTGWSLVFYNGTSGFLNKYLVTALAGTIPNQSNGFGTVWTTVAGIQNGGSSGPAPDGVALVDATSKLVQFLSYEGAFTPIDGPAAGVASTDIVKREHAWTPVGLSLQLTGKGKHYSAFVWTDPVKATPGQPNAGQTFE